MKLKSNNKVRVLLYSTQLMPTGGIESHILKFCTKLKNAGVKIDIVVSNFLMNDAELEQLRTSCNKVLVHRGKANAIEITFWLFMQACKLFLVKYDVIYTNGQGDSPYIFRGLMARKIKWVHHHHTSGDLSDQKTWSEKYLKTLKRSSEVIACSTSNAASMSKFLNREIITIPCFSNKIPKNEKRVSGKLRIGYYGRLIPEKGIDTICKLSNEVELSNVEFHIWGEATSYNKSFFDQFPKLNYHGSFYGIKELENVINFIDCFVLISTHPEGLPICLLEALGAGLPWLSTDKGGIRDIAIDPNATRIISSHSKYVEIKNAIISFANDIYKGKVDNHLEIDFYDKNFSEYVIVDRWIKLFKKSNIV